MSMSSFLCSGIGTLSCSLCQSFRQPQKCREGRISVVPQPYGTELYDLINARDRPENYPRKLQAHCGFTGQAHSQAYRNEMHQRLTADVKLLNGWFIART